MKPGKELDKLVAEKVMGWYLSTNEWMWVQGGECVRSLPTWSPSTNIEDAWLVVEKLQELPPIHRGDSYEWFAIDAPNRTGDNTWEVGWKYYYDYEGDSWHCNAVGLTVMEAICKAALERVNDI